MENILALLQAQEKQRVDESGTVTRNSSVMAILEPTPVQEKENRRERRPKRASKDVTLSGTPVSKGAISSLSQTVSTSRKATAPSPVSAESHAPQRSKMRGTDNSTEITVVSSYTENPTVEILKSMIAEERVTLQQKLQEDLYRMVGGEIENIGKTVVTSLKQEKDQLLERVAALEEEVRTLKLVVIEQQSNRKEIQIQSQPGKAKPTALKIRSLENLAKLGIIYLPEDEGKFEQDLKTLKTKKGGNLAGALRFAAKVDMVDDTLGALTLEAIRNIDVKEYSIGATGAKEIPMPVALAVTRVGSAFFSYHLGERQMQEAIMKENEAEALASWAKLLVEYFKEHGKSKYEQEFALARTFCEDVKARTEKCKLDSHPKFLALAESFSLY